MDEDQSFEIIGEVDAKDKKIKQLKQKLKETEEQLNELNRNLEQRVIERTVEVNRLLKHKIRFIDNLSHDLGTPLTPLISLLPMIKEEVKKIETKELIDTLIRNVEYIKRVIQNARELADVCLRSEADGRGEVEKRWRAGIPSSGTGSGRVHRTGPGPLSPL